MPFQSPQFSWGLWAKVGYAFSNGRSGRVAAVLLSADTVEKVEKRASQFFR
jgi:hypothetical protein